MFLIDIHLGFRLRALSYRKIALKIDDTVTYDTHHYYKNSKLIKYLLKHLSDEEDLYVPT